MSADIDLVYDLVKHFPYLNGSFEAHLFNEGEVLTFVFFHDVTLEVVQSFISNDDGGLDWKGVLDFLEERLAGAPQNVIELIVTGFVYYLPYPHQPGYAITRDLGPGLSQYLRSIRGGTDTAQP